MPDIEMCLGEGCPKRANCYRANATPSGDQQAYGSNDPDNCDAYWPTCPGCGQRGYEEDRPFLVCGWRG